LAEHFAGFGKKGLEAKADEAYWYEWETPETPGTDAEANAAHEVDQQRTAEGSCWTCGEAGHQKKECPVWQANQRRLKQSGNARTGVEKPRRKFKAKLASACAALMHAISEIESGGEDGGSSGNRTSVTPE
jgi:hypothetical protein